MMERSFSRACWTTALCSLVLSGCSGAGGLAAPIINERVSVLQARLAADTSDPVAYYNVAMGYWSRKAYDRADSTLLRALALDPEFALAHLAVALVQLPNESRWKRIRREGGDTAVMQEVRYREREYTRAFLIDPFLDVRALGLFTQTYEEEYSNTTEAMDYYRNRRAMLRDSMPRSLVWYHSIAAARSNHLADAIADVQSLARVSRNRELSGTVSPTPLLTNHYLYVLAALLQRTGHADDAMRLYLEVLTADIANYEAHGQLARIYEASNDWGHALEQRRAAVDVFPENHCLVMDLGITQYHAGVLPDAEESLRQAREAGPRDARVYYWLGTVQQARAEKAEARATFETFLRLAPTRDSVRVAAVRQTLAGLQ
jgi:tetratricopeptide (TPR) repeat protein